MQCCFIIGQPRYQLPHWGPYLRVDSLMVKGQPRGSTSYAPGFPATVELEAAAPAAPLTVALQPYLQWMNSSPICSATAMLFTTTVSLAASTGHLSAKGANGVVSHCSCCSRFFLRNKYPDKTFFCLTWSQGTSSAESVLMTRNNKQNERSLALTD